jgi:hypothetical protein
VLLPAFNVSDGQFRHRRGNRRQGLSRGVKLRATRTASPSASGYCESKPWPIADNAAR